MRKLLRTAGTPVVGHPDRGLDHGAYVPLAEMYPDADVPVLQVSMPTLDPEGLYQIGRKLAPLRDQGVLIVGSGFFTHNLRALSMDGRVAPVMAEFDHWGADALAHGDLDELLDFEHKATGRAPGAPAHRALRAAVRHAGCRGRRPGRSPERDRRLLVRHGQALHPGQLTQPARPPGLSR